MRERLTFAARGPVKSAQRVLEILDYFASTRAPATLSALSSALELPKSSCLALIATLHVSGYLYEVKPGVGYYPTRRWLDRATGITASDPLATKMRPVMLALSEETGETIILGKRAGDRVIYIEVVESSQTLRYAAVAGQFKPLHGTASGKALLGGDGPNRTGRAFPPVQIHSLDELDDKAAAPHWTVTSNAGPIGAGIFHVARMSRTRPLSLSRSS